MIAQSCEFTNKDIEFTFKSWIESYVNFMSIYLLTSNLYNYKKETKYYYIWSSQKRGQLILQVSLLPWRTYFLLRYTPEDTRSTLLLEYNINLYAWMQKIDLPSCTSTYNTCDLLSMYLSWQRSSPNNSRYQKITLDLSLSLLHSFLEEWRVCMQGVINRMYLDVGINYYYIYVFNYLTYPLTLVLSPGK